MKVLWFSNVSISKNETTSTGTWIQPLINLITLNNDIELYIIATSNVKTLTRHDYSGVKQWLVESNFSRNAQNLPNTPYLEVITKLVKEISPDVIHVWGTESFWGTLFTNDFIRGIPILLEMQGLKGECGKIFTADLTISEKISCLGIKELVTRKNLFTNKASYTSWGKLESAFIAKADIINVQSDWMENLVRSKCKGAIINRICLPLRAEFYNAESWKQSNLGLNNNIFIMSSGATPYKGVHTAIRALAIIREYTPNVRLKVAGKFVFDGIRKDGYACWLRSLAKKLEVWDCIDWLGSISAAEIITVMQNARVNLVCSFIESYCLALAEAMYLGVPCVSSYNGGTSYLGDDSSVLFYQAGDYADCAFKVLSLMDSKNSIMHKSLNMKNISKDRHNISFITNNLFETYRKLNDNKNTKY